MNILKGKGTYDYDYENDIVFVHIKGIKSDDAIDHDPFIIDLDEQKRIVGIEILGVSKLFNLPKIFFKNLVKGSLKANIKGNYITIVLDMASKIRNSIKEKSVIFQREKDKFVKNVAVECVV